MNQDPPPPEQRAQQQEKQARRVERDWETLIEEGYECAINDLHTLVVSRLPEDSCRILLAIIKKAMEDIGSDVSRMRQQLLEYRDGRGSLTEDEFESTYEEIELKSYDLMHLEKMLRAFSTTLDDNTD